MKYQPLSRRMFLTGAGGTALAIPFLPSLLPSAAAQTPVTSLKYLQILQNMGPPRESAMPTTDLVPNTDIGARTRVRPLQDLIDAQGRISEVYDEAWNDIAGRINFVTGFHGYWENQNHHACGATTGSGIVAGVDQVEQAVNPYSIDWVLEQHIYQGGPAPKYPALRVNLGRNTKYEVSHCFGGARECLPKDGVYEQLEAKILGAGEPPDERKMELLDRVMEDYDRVSTHPRLSSVDRQRFEGYVESVADVLRREEIVLACSEVDFGDSENFGVRHRNALHLMALGFACGATRIGSYVLVECADDNEDRVFLHNSHHDDPTAMTGIGRWRAGVVADAIRMLDETLDETGESLLNNMVVYHAPEYASMGHANMDFAAIVAGNAGGRLETGHWVDAGGAPSGRVLITMMKAMGLSIEQIERDGVVGFGGYDPSRVGDVPADALDEFLSDEGRRQGLPIVAGWDLDDPNA